MTECWYHIWHHFGSSKTNAHRRTVMGKTRRCKSGGQNKHTRTVWPAVDRLESTHEHEKSKADASKDKAVTDKDTPYTASPEAQAESFPSGKSDTKLD